MIYLQLAPTLKFPMGPGVADVVSRRPRDQKGRYLDLEQPTLVEIPEAAVGVNVAMLLSTGAIAEVPANEELRMKNEELRRGR